MSTIMTLLAEAQLPDSPSARLDAELLLAAALGKPRSFLRTWPERDQICFEVEDRGIGILDDELPHLFDAFYRSERVVFSTSGSGLGLELVQRALDMHQGRIEIEQLSQGSLFRIRMPWRG